MGTDTRLTSEALASNGDYLNTEELTKLALSCKNASGEATSPSPEVVLVLIEELADARASADFYKRRVDLLQQWQSKMRDPERTIACDILANGQTLPPAHAGTRYKVPDDALQARLAALSAVAALATAGAPYSELTNYLQSEINKCEGALG